MRIRHLCLLTCSVQAAIVWAALHGAPLLAALALHVLAAAFSTLAIADLLPVRLRSPLATQAVFVFCALIPGVGAPGLAFALAVARLPAAAPAEDGLARIDLAPREPLPSPLRLAAAEIRGALWSRDPGRRVQAVQATRSLPTRDAARLLSAALRDSADDVRLPAHALLQQREKELELRLRATSSALAAATGERRVALHRTLAFHAFELVSQGIAQGGMRTRTLEDALAHARAALGVRADAELELLCSRIHLAQDRLDEAAAALCRASGAGLPMQRALPYAAELAFRRRDFAGVRQCLALLDPRTRRSATLQAVTSFWS